MATKPQPLAFNEMRSYDLISMQAVSEFGHRYVIRPSRKASDMFDVMRNGMLIGGAESVDDCGVIAQNHHNALFQRRQQR